MAKILADADRSSRMQAETPPIGVRLRRQRQQRGLTLKEVADAAGLSVGFISQIERDISTPSLSSLVSIARVLKVEVGTFLAQPRGDVPLTRHEERAVYAIGGNTVSYERISSSFAGNVLRSVIIHEPPGHRGEPIAHDGEEMMFVLEGAISVELGGDRTILETGDSLHFPSSTTHSTWNHTDRAATILWVGTMDVFGEGPGDVPDAIHLVPTRQVDNEKAVKNDRGMTS